MLAQSPDRPMEGRRGKRHSAMQWLQQLYLTPEHLEQIQAIREQAQTDSESLREQLQQQHNALQNLHQELGDRRFKTLLEVREVLTCEQRTQLAELRPQHQQERNQRRDR